MTKRKVPITVIAAPVDPGWNSILAGGDGTKIPFVLDGEPVVEALRGLASHFGTAENDWFMLAMKLAFAGGFIRYERKSGAKGRWDAELLLALWIEVQVWKHNQSLSVDATFHDSAFLESWREKCGELDKPTTLSARYYEAAKLPLPAALERLLDQTQPDGPWAELERFSSDLLRIRKTPTVSI